MAELIWRLRTLARPGPGARRGDLWWGLAVGGAGALALAWALSVSIQAATSLVAVVLVIALYRHDRRLGVAAVLGLWLLAPGLRRLLGLHTGYLESDPLSLAPFLATAAVAALELPRVHVPERIRRILLVAAAGFAVGLPLGLVAGPTSAVYAFAAYLAGIGGAVLGMGESGSVRGSVLRSVLLFGMVPVAVYAILQRVLPLPEWDEFWLDASGFTSIAVEEGPGLRVFATLNSPATLAALLGLSLLCYLTVERARPAVIAGATIVGIALALTFVRSAWLALVVAGLAHVVASRGRSAPLVLGVCAVAVATTLALAPINPTARDLVERVSTFRDLKGDTSAAERQATFTETLPAAAQAPLGHGLGTAGEPSKLTGEAGLRTPDNGYLALIYQVGPLGFLLVIGALAFVARAAWVGARDPGPGQEMRLLVFAMLVYLLVLMLTGDQFYGIQGVALWFVAGQALAYEMRRQGAHRLRS